MFQNDVVTVVVDNVIIAQSICALQCDRHVAARKCNSVGVCGASQGTQRHLGSKGKAIVGGRKVCNGDKIDIAVDPKNIIARAECEECIIVADVENIIAGAAVDGDIRADDVEGIIFVFAVDAPTAVDGDHLTVGIVDG